MFAQTYTFTSAGVSGPTGPSQTQINTAYASTNLNGSVTVTGGIQSFTVPLTGPYRITAVGGRGGYDGGFGASITGEFTLTAGTVLRVLVGQAGTQLGNGSFIAGGGGGGTYVTDNANVPFVVAGGGGGQGDGYAGGATNSTITGLSAALTTTGYAFPFPTGGTNGGTGGNGGICAPSLPAGSGAGIYGNGSVCSSNLAALSFTNGGTGGYGTTSGSGDGGFGGGGGGYSSGVGNRGGGGGGYSGGGGGTAVASEPQAPGGGGGSFNAGVNQVNAVSTSTGNGRVVLEFLCNVGISASTSNSLAPAICSGNSVTLTTNADNSISWSTGSTAVNSIVVTPSVTTTYSVLGASSALSCSNAAYITVTVSAAAPVLSISNPSNNICLGKAVTLTASGALTYTWVNAGVINGQSFMPAATAVYTVNGQNGCGITTATTAITVAPIQVSTLASPTLVCESFTTALTAVSAATSYTWYPGAYPGANVVVSPTANTIYTVAVSDGTCAGTQTVAVFTKTTPTITSVISSTNICAGEVVSLTASGAGSGGTYSWSPSGSTAATFTDAPTANTIYGVVGTASNGCSGSNGNFVVVNAGPAVSVGAVNNKTLVCSGSTTTLTLSGSSTYTWSTGPTGTPFNVTQTAASTIYTVLASGTTNTCVTTKTIEIQAVIPNVTNTSSLAICNGQSGQLTATGANLYSYNGSFPSSNGTITINPTSSTVYTLIATTSSGTVSCPVTKTIPVTVNSLPTLSVGATKSVVCKGEKNTFTVTGASNYTWSSGPTTATMTATLTANTNYSIVGVDANGCQSVLNYQARINNCTGIDNLAAGTVALSVYPNPANTSVKILSEVSLEAKLINSLGQVVQTVTIEAGSETSVSVRELSAGVYFLVGENAGQKVNQKIVVSH